MDHSSIVMLLSFTIFIVIATMSMVDAFEGFVPPATCQGDDDCLHGGYCQFPDHPRGAHNPFCECPGPFGGTYCEELEDCVLDCGKDGTCTAIAKDPDNLFTTEWNYACECPEGKSGNACQYSSTLSTNSHQDHDCISNQECLNGGHCIVATHNTIYHPNYCDCPTGYRGTNCEICPSDLCDNGGTCKTTIPAEDILTSAAVARTFDFTCECTEAWTGDRCQFPSDGHNDQFANMHDCETDSDCLNGGQCLKSNGNSLHPNYCNCAMGFKGTKCAEVVDEGDDVNGGPPAQPNTLDTGDESDGDTPSTVSTSETEANADSTDGGDNNWKLGLSLGLVAGIGVVLIALIIGISRKKKDKYGIETSPSSPGILDPLDDSAVDEEKDLPAIS